jgi:hypothetical protein
LTPLDFPPPPPKGKIVINIFSLTLRTRFKTLLPSAQNNEYILKQMSSNTGTNKFPLIVLPTIALASTACALLVQNHHRVGHVPAIFKRIFGRFGEKKTKKTKEKETPFDENETIKTASNDEKDDDAKAVSKSSSSKEVKEEVTK